jgi:hypothetical protein
MVLRRRVVANGTQPSPALLFAVMTRTGVIRAFREHHERRTASPAGMSGSGMAMHSAAQHHSPSLQRSPARAMTDAGAVL